MTLFPSNNKTTAHKRGFAAASFGAVAAIALAFSAPAIAGPGGHGDHGNMEGHKMSAPKFSFGEPAPDATPDVRVEMDALDTMRFSPETVSVKAGSVVEFVVTNKGQIPHAWSVDTIEGQKKHEEGMKDMPMSNMMGHMDDEPNGFVLKAGETKSLIWKFNKSGTLQFACHLPGHFDAGMHSTLEVTGGDHDDKGKKAHQH